MAVPKRKTTVSRRNKRRSHHKISNVNVIEDKKTGEYDETGNIIETTAQQRTFNSLNEMPKHALKPGTLITFN